MIKILLNGCCGRMGRAVVESAREKSAEFAVVAGVDTAGGMAGYPIYTSLLSINEEFDVIVDFSHHSCTEALLTYAVGKKKPVVIATTGHTERETLAITRAAEFIPVFYSRNMSIGINVLIELARAATASLGDDFDIEIVEEHHAKKLDAPSGTALMIAGAVEEARGEQPEYIYDRHLMHRERARGEIGIHSVRGGSIVGEHTIIFAGKNETVRISHSAGSREVFAEGALRAAGFVVGRPAGSYTMKDAIKGQ